jgi:hypothetical protein
VPQDPVTPEWSNVAGSHARVVWHVSQLEVVGTCVAGLPLAWTPLWHVEQVPGVTPAWSNRAPTKLVVLWQVSQLAVVGTCVAGFPVAVTPLWQVPQDPGMTEL